MQKSEKRGKHALHKASQVLKNPNFRLSRRFRLLLDVLQVYTRSDKCDADGGEQYSCVQFVHVFTLSELVNQ